ncbi:MAG: Rpp14/Pop5 family protein [Candidatus Bathyarchaeia archaeon]
MQIESAEKFSSKEFTDNVWNAILKLYGEYGASQTGLSLIDYDDDKQLAIVRVSHTALKMVRASLATITRISDKPASIHVLAVSGTIKALHKKLSIHRNA